MKELCDRIQALARQCGEILKNADRSGIDVDAKEGHANFVTKYDRLVQDELQKGLDIIMPEAGFFGEEGEHSGFPENEYVFIIDPIDGTTNFIKDLSLSCIAISLTRNRERVMSVVYNPFTDEMFTAIKGEGARLNGRPIKVSSKPLAMGLAIFGTSPYYDGLSELAFAAAKEYLKKCIDVRRLGSAELDLCYVACGRAELYFEPMLMPWDIAAGSLIVEEAGGRVVNWNGAGFDITKPTSCIAHGSGFVVEKLSPEAERLVGEIINGVQKG